jgi:uncharacterized protein YdhG (YjbR/CyaY superfamily)
LIVRGIERHERKRDMHSHAETVDEYIDFFQGNTRQVLSSIRSITHEEMPQYEELMKYRMPTYRYHDQVFAFAVQKRYLSVYVKRENLIRKYRGEIGKHNLGKNCILYAKPEYDHLEGLRRLIAECYEDAGAA